MKILGLNLALFVLLLCGKASATVSLALQFGVLTTSQSVVIPGGSLWALISENDSGDLPGGLLINNALSASANNQEILADFAGTTIATGQTVGGGVVVATGSTTDSASDNGEGFINTVLTNVDLTALGLNTGDKLGIYWFPGRTPSSNAIPTGSDFEIGGFHQASASDGSGGNTGMSVPADGANLKMFYFDSDVTSGVTSFDPSLFQAVTVPEPSTLLLVSVAVLFAVRRRR